MKLARFMLGDEGFCIVRVAGLEAADPTKLTEILTAGELQIATLVALGQLNKQIAAQPHISEWTVATHVRRVFCKLGVFTRAGMVYRCTPLIGRRPDPTLSSSVRAACLLAVLARPEGDRDDLRRPLAVAVGEDSGPSVSPWPRVPLPPPHL